jgi:hypothetical protein
VVVVEGTDALNFNNLVISAEVSTNPIVKNYQCQMIKFLILFLNIFELFVTKNIVPNFYEKKFHFPHTLGNSSLFNEFSCNLSFFWHEWASLKLE